MTPPFSPSSVQPPHAAAASSAVSVVHVNIAAAAGDAPVVRALCLQGVSAMTRARVRSELGWHHEVTVV